MRIIIISFLHLKLLKITQLIRVGGGGGGSGGGKDLNPDLTSQPMKITYYISLVFCISVPGNKLLDKQ